MQGSRTRRGSKVAATTWRQPQLLPSLLPHIYANDSGSEIALIARKRGELTVVLCSLLFALPRLCDGAARGATLPD